MINSRSDSPAAGKVHLLQLFAAEFFTNPPHRRVQFPGGRVGQNRHGLIQIGLQVELAVFHLVGMAPVDLYGFAVFIDRCLKGNPSTGNLDGIALGHLQQPGITGPAAEKEENPQFTVPHPASKGIVLNPLHTAHQRYLCLLLRGRWPGHLALAQHLGATVLKFFPTTAGALLISTDFCHLAHLSCPENQEHLL
jgi:hypothetical protein